ncbi:MAG: N-6 DNA methylase, partial [Opitutales bacterium]|nr:N-6 DNA methylase [Opitutales bacterium]
MNLSATIKSIQDIMRKDDGVDGDAQRIGQLAWMLFLKVFDQCEEGWEEDYADRGETYASPIPDNCRWRNWAKYKDGKPQIAPSKLADYVNNTVFPGLKEINVDGNAVAKVVREVFADANNYMKSGTLLLGIIEKLDEAINFHDIKTRGQLGTIYEQILNDLRSAGNSGEFYTPRAVTEFMVKMVNPSLKKRETVLDPACGTGGFLTATIDHFEQQLTKKSSTEDRRAVGECIRGIEKKQLPHLLCTTNILLHGIEVPSMIEHRNTLAKGWNDWSPRERVDCVITNPPFGGMEDEGVGSDFPSDVQTRETADMFLVLIVKKLLKDGGRGAVVLPDGTLFGEGVKAKVKRLLLDECNLHTIIRLPNGVFNPYTGIKTNLLFFTKGQPTETIWYYEHRYPEGVKSYSKTKPLRVEELDPIKDWWGSEADGFTSRKETDQAWKIDFKTLKAESEAKAKPHWDKAEQLNNEAENCKGRVRYLRKLSSLLKTEKKPKQVLRDELKDIRKQLKANAENIHLQNLEAILSEAEGANNALFSIDASIKKQTEQSTELTSEAKDAQAAGDRIFWPIYNLDIKNPRAPEGETHDPDKLLSQLN